jgi:hypothetical protein
MYGSEGEIKEFFDASPTLHGAFIDAVPAPLSVQNRIDYMFETV